MDDKVKNHAGKGSAEQNPSQEPGPRATGPRIVFCAWCRTVTVFPGRATDVIAMLITATERLGMMATGRIEIQDGICEPCRVAKFPDTVKR